MQQRSRPTSSPAGCNSSRPPSITPARPAAARLRYPLNLGDCFAYALSAAENCPILTLDSDFQKCDRPILFPPGK